MDIPKRSSLSMNSSLKEAMIFADDSDDEDYSHYQFEDIIKKINEKNACRNSATPNIPREDETPSPNPQKAHEGSSASSDNISNSTSRRKRDNEFSSIKIKEEPIDHDEQFDKSPSESLRSKTKLENFNENLIKLENIKEEFEDNSISLKVAEMGLLTPIKAEVASSNKNNRKIVKRNLVKQRNSPYSKEKPTTSQQRTPIKRDRIEKLLSPSKNKIRKINPKSNGKETNPDVLRRRQKQIDFGKNTIGYDNYIKQVPRSERKQDDPVTPNIYRSYSRRGFDGLIKQWRLKLHKYDP